MVRQVAIVLEATAMRDIHKPDPPWLKWSFTAAVLAAIVAAVSWPARENYPIKDGSAEDYWRAVDSESSRSCERQNLRLVGHDRYTPRDGYLLYERLPAIAACGVWESSHSWVYRVRADEVVNHPAAQLAEVDPCSRLRLLREDDKNDLRELKQVDPAAFAEVQAERADFHVRLSHLRDFWVWQAVLEAGFLMALALFVLWPWLRSLSGYRCALHLGLVPWLLCLPFWFGYSSGGRDDSVLGTGGVLYPELLRPLGWIPWTPLDSDAASHFPNPLSMLSAPPGHSMEFALVNKNRVSIVGVGVISLLLIGIGALFARRCGASQAEPPDIRIPDSPGA